MPTWRIKPLSWQTFVVVVAILIGLMVVVMMIPLPAIFHR